MGEHFETVVVGGSQAGLAVGYQLRQRGRPFVILDASERVGDAWRNRWDSCTCSLRPGTTPCPG
jgi:putative flavoprotein involved in K+ transport